MRDVRKSLAGTECRGCGIVISAEDTRARRGHCSACALVRDRAAKVAAAERKAAGLPPRPPTWEQLRADRVRRLHEMGVFDERNPEWREWLREQRRAEVRARMRGESPPILAVSSVEVPEE